MLRRILCQNVFSDIYSNNFHPHSAIVGWHLRPMPRICGGGAARKGVFRFAGVVSANDGKYKAENEVASQQEPRVPLS